MNYFSAACRGSALPVRLLRRATAVFAFFAVVGSVMAQGTGSLTGSVTSDATRNALQGAVVTLPSLNRTVLTDESGRFLLADVPPGVVEIVVSYAGFSDTRQQINVSATGATNVDIPMKSS